jgi:Neuraminidase (sialidase)
LGAVSDLGCSPTPCVLPNIQISAGEANGTVIAASPSNPARLLAGAFDQNDCFGAAAFSSGNGGSTWKSNCLRGLALSGDPTVAYGRRLEYFAGTNGTSSGAATYVETSANNGVTWSSALQVVAPLFASGVTNIPLVQVDNSGGSPFANAVYVSVTQFDSLVVESEISVSHSSDGGKTWTTTTVDPVQYKPEVDQFSRMAVGKDGTVYVAWQRCTTTGPDENCADTQAHMLLSKSSDGGNTWSAPVKIAAVKLLPDDCDCSFFGNLPNTRESIANVPLIAVDNSKGTHAGNLYAVMYNWTGKQMRVQVVTSTNGGNTWGKPVLVAPPKQIHDQFFASIAVSPNGVAGVSWLDRRHDPLNVSYQPFAAISMNGGASFGKNYVLAKTLSDPYLDGSGGYYMGDYTGSTWAGSKFLATWPDTRNLQFMQDYVGGLQIK